MTATPKRGRLNLAKLFRSNSDAARRRLAESGVPIAPRKWGPRGEPGTIACPNCGKRGQDRYTVCDHCGFAVRD